MQEAFGGAAGGFAPASTDCRPRGPLVLDRKTADFGPRVGCEPVAISEIGEVGEMLSFFKNAFLFLYLTRRKTMTH